MHAAQLADGAISALLSRPPVMTEADSLSRLLRGRRLLITGAAGSIGSELARHACRYGPESIALFDRDENGLFFLARELADEQSAIPCTPVLGDVRDEETLDAAFDALRPQVVLHAAAHKHVPLLEAHPAEAVKNNVFGTCAVAERAHARGAAAFVLISTDKAVNPTSVMGATKRVAERYVQALAGESDTRFATVRFGNVLGTNGSVVQVFREQILRGGPLTVTHPDMRRYFITSGEACELVLQAGALATGGEIFLLDMGSPLGILDLARGMIRLTGARPDVDIPIEFVGMRPGEKLCEEVVAGGEAVARTAHPKILVARGPGPSRAALAKALGRLREAVSGGPDELRAALTEIVPEARLTGAGAPEVAVGTVSAGA